MNYRVRSSSQFFILCILSLFFSFILNAQTDFSANNFQTYQLSSPRVAKAYAQYNGSLHREFAAKGFDYNNSEILLRAFKAHNEFEVWVRNKDVDTFALFKEYKICALSGVLGPKRWEGDRQVPEGYYFISDFNPNSEYYLSLLVNYPNYSDKILSNKITPGGDIYVHGGCVTVGCLPMTDKVIQEIYTLCLNSRIHGQTNIPIQIFPVRFNQTGISFLTREYGNDEVRQRFWLNLKAGYDYFEKNKKTLPVMYDQKGRYIY